MRPAKNLEKFIKNIDIDTNIKADETVLNDAIKAFESSKNKKTVTHPPDIWRIIMKSRITKLGAAAAIIVVALIGIHMLSSVGGASLAFADVLKHIRSSSYSFDLTVGTQEEASTTVHTMVLEPGRMRLDTSTGLGKISSIINTSEGKNLILFHKQKAAYMFNEVSDPEKYAGAVGIIALCTKPINNLWNLRDGTEEKLGKKEIDGQNAEGFQIFQEDQIFQNDITIWAHVKTGVPILVEMISTLQDDSSKSMTWTMNNFDLDVELAESMFSLDLPPGYTLCHQLDLDELQTGTEPSVEGKKIEEMLAIWSKDQNSKALEILLGIDWTKTFNFSRDTYIFTITEKEYISLKLEDQQKVMNEISATGRTVRNIAKEVRAMGREAMSAKDYKKAEQYFEAVLQLGKLSSRNPDNALIVRLVGIAVQKLALNEQVSLYTETNNQEKLEAAKDLLQALNAESERIRSQVTGQ
jgi:outer membrane lipoprotein-sorting protein